MFNWLKGIFSTEYKGSSKEFRQLYKEAKSILDKKIISFNEEIEVIEIMRDLTRIMKTNGDGRLVTELQVKMRMHMRKKD